MPHLDPDKLDWDMSEETEARRRELVARRLSEQANRDYRIRHPKLRAWRQALITNWTMVALSGGVLILIIVLARLGCA